MARTFGNLGPLPRSLPVGPDSLSWRIGREPSLLVGGGRALLLQVTHPLVAAGVDQHSNYQADPWSRLFATLDTVYRMMFADPETAAKAAERLKRRHAMVNGEAEDGTPYDALDPDLQLWVWGTLVDTALVVYERSLGPLSDEMRTRYLEEQKLFAYACGVPEGACPETYKDFTTYVDAVVNDVLRPTKVAHDVALSLRQPPVPRALQVLGGPVAVVTAGLLPAHLRVALGFEWGPSQQRSFNAFFLAARAQRAVPGPLRRLPITLSAKRSKPMTPPRWLVRQSAAG
jgi:uncharacterized protein (DUF2236 family)